MFNGTPIIETFDWIPEGGCYEELIFKRLVLGYVVIEWKSNIRSHVSRHITSRPILSADPGDNEATDSEMGGGSINLSDDETVINVIPAPFPTYKVYSFDIRGDESVMGFEHPGLPVPDWVGILRDRWSEQIKHCEV